MVNDAGVVMSSQGELLEAVGEVREKSRWRIGIIDCVSAFEISCFYGAFRATGLDSIREATLASSLLLFVSLLAALPTVLCWRQYSGYLTGLKTQSVASHVWVAVSAAVVASFVGYLIAGSVVFYLHRQNLVTDPNAVELAANSLIVSAISGGLVAVHLRLVYWTVATSLFAVFGFWCGTLLIGFVSAVS